MFIDKFTCDLNCAEVKPQLQDIKKRLHKAELKKNELLKDLTVVQNSLNFTQGQQFDFLLLCGVCFVSRQNWTQSYLKNLK